MKEYLLWLAKVVTLLVAIPIFLSAVVGSLVVAGGSGTGEKSVTAGDDKVVAVVELVGMITSSKELLEKMYDHIADDNVLGIVLRIDSPGGSVGPSQEIYSAVRRLKDRKPIVASMGSVATSGGLYAALGASKVFAQPGTLTGSIGVLLQMPNFTKIAETVGLEMVTIKSGALKDVGNSFRDMTQKEQDFLQDTVLEAHRDFIQAVVDGRGIDKQEVVSFADGRMILGSQAKTLNLIDDFGDVYDAARAVYELTGTPLEADETPKIRYEKSKFEEFRKLFESFLNIPDLVTDQPIRFQYR